MYDLRSAGHSVADWLARFLLVQLFINLLTWPLFLGWGLPITPLSIVGNLVFSPFLTAFLFISSLMVTCQFFNFCPSFLISALEWLTSFWMALVKYPVPDCMITCITPPLWLSLVAPVSATYIIRSKQLPHIFHKISGLLSVYCILILIFSCLPTPTTLDIRYGTHTVTVLKQDKKLVLIDPGFARRKQAIYQWIMYTLLPELGRSFGTQTVDTVILKKQSPSALACAELLKKYVHVKNVVLI